MLKVFVISFFIMIVPQNLCSTIPSKIFIAYMGIKRCGLRIDIQQTASIEGKIAELAKILAQDGNVSRYAPLTAKT